MSHVCTGMQLLNVFECLIFFVFLLNNFDIFLIQVRTLVRLKMLSGFLKSAPEHLLIAKRGKAGTVLKWDLIRTCCKPVCW